MEKQLASHSGSSACGGSSAWFLISAAGLVALSVLGVVPTAAAVAQDQSPGNSNVFQAGAGEHAAWKGDVARGAVADPAYSQGFREYITPGAITPTASGLVIIPTFDTSITGDPNAAAIQAMINQSIAIYQAQFSDPITVRIFFRYSTNQPNGTPMGSALARSNFVIYTIAWSTFINALTADAATGNDNTANASLPASALSPNIVPSSAGGRAVGLNTPGVMDGKGGVGSGTYDGIVTLNSSQPFQFTRPPSGSNYDALRSTEHEIDEVLGLGSFLNGGGSDLRPQDLFSWGSPGTRNLTATGSRYFSINSGNTNIVGLNQDPNGDFGDWISPACPQADPYVQNAFSCPGQFSDVTATSPEGVNLDVIGYDLGTTGPTPTPAPTPTPVPSCTPTSQGFDDIATLVPGGWFIQNNSQPGPGTTTWFQGTSTVFPAQGGAGASYIGANFNSGTDVSTLSNWLLTPALTLQNGVQLTFYTRTIDAPQFPDRLQVRMSTSGASTNVGTTATSVGDFTALLLDINPTYTATGYPNVWTQFTATVSGLGAPTTGRLAFRYFVENGGPNGANSDYIGIDTLQITGGCGGSTPTVLGNISTRMLVQTGNNVLIGGFIITGTQPKRLILRAIGPSLPLPGVIFDTVLDLRNSSGSLIATNDNWRTDQQAEIIATGIPPSNDLESAIVVTLPANSSAYTAIVRGFNDATGIGVVEAYDLDRTVDSKLANISTRGFVSTGDDVMIGGTIIIGTNSANILIRAIGPSLVSAGVPNAISDPTLELRDGNGALLNFNDDWRTDQQAEIIATGIPPTNDLESAIVRSLAPGAYTAIVRGYQNATGVALVEAYQLQ